MRNELQPTRRTPLKLAAEASVGELFGYLREKYVDLGWDGPAIVEDLASHMGRHRVPSVKSIYYWMDIGGIPKRTHKERNDIENCRTPKVERKRLAALRRSGYKMSEAQKRIWKKRKFGQFVAKNGIPFATITASKHA